MPSRAADAKTPSHGAPETPSSPRDASGATYYLSPVGSDSAAGTSVAGAWRTFGRAFSSARPLRAGDTLVLLDGVYTAATTGLPSISCATSGGNANDGTAAAPITIRAQNERRAFLKADGTRSAFVMQSCSYYDIVGLRAENRDLVGGASGAGYPFRFVSSFHLTIRRNLAAYPNRYANAHGFGLEQCGDSLLEENEVYYAHRHAFSIFQSENVTLRRNYANSRNRASVGGFADDNVNGGDEGISIYDSSRCRSENNVMERTEGFEVHSGYSTYAGNPGGWYNTFSGDISHHDEFGAGPDGRGSALSPKPARYNTYRDLVVARATGEALKLRSASDTVVENVTVFAGEANGFYATNNSGSYPRCTDLPAPGCTSRASNVLSFGNAGVGILAENQQSWTIESSNSHGNASGNYYCWDSACVSGETTTGLSDAAGNIRSSLSVAPTGMGANACILWVPDGSNMKGAGKGGADIGANVLYRWVDGVLTREPLWDRTTGAYSCGATVRDTSESAYPMITDDSSGASVGAEACGNLHRRLNVNTNGCSFPAAY